MRNLINFLAVVKFNEKIQAWTKFGTHELCDTGHGGAYAVQWNTIHAFTFAWYMIS